MSIIDDWINPYYLEDATADMIRESMIAKPDIKYAVLDNFFKLDKLEELIKQHKDLDFSEEKDRVVSGVKLPYDGSVVFAKSGEHYGSELFFDDEWHRYCCYIANIDIKLPATTEIKLRKHRPYADGFWIHTDSEIKNQKHRGAAAVIIAYFNKAWKASHGGLLQMWRVDEVTDENSFFVNSPNGRMDFLATNKRIYTSTPGGGFLDKKPHDLVLVDQILPIFNRIFICNFQHSPAYHSITPSNGRSRTGFVQWLYD